MVEFTQDCFEESRHPFLFDYMQLAPFVMRLTSATCMEHTFGCINVSSRGTEHTFVWVHH